MDGVLAVEFAGLLQWFNNGGALVAPAVVEPEPTPLRLRDVPTAAPTPVVPQTDIERLICAHPWPCGEALAVARCESGPDYYADPWENPGHRGAYQLSYVHAWRFAARGWDWETDGVIVERNAAIAYEIFSEQGWRPWACSP